jgi:hypothetical protein
MILCHNQELKLNVKQQDVNVLIIVIFQFMDHKILNVHVNILIKIMMVLKKIVKIVLVKHLLQIGHVHVVCLIVNIKLFHQKHKNKKIICKVFIQHKEKLQVIVQF